MKEGDTVAFGQSKFQVIDTPGHTRGHISFFSPDGDIPALRRHAVQPRLRPPARGHAQGDVRKPAEIRQAAGRYRWSACGHEYTQANARFALTVEPDNTALKQRAAEIDRQRAAGEATVPTRLGRGEGGQTRFMRAKTAEALATIRTGKDNFK